MLEKGQFVVGIFPEGLVLSYSLIFSACEGKNNLAMAYSIFISSATIVALQSDCFMQRTSRTATNGDQRRLGGSRVLQETKPGRTRERPAKECQDFCERAVYVSELANWQCEVPKLQDCLRAI